MSDYFCSRTTDFMSDRRQNMRLGKHTLLPGHQHQILPNTAFVPLKFSLFTNSCIPLIGLSSSQSLEGTPLSSDSSLVGMRPSAGVRLTIWQPGAARPVHFLGTIISQHFKWELHSSSLIRKAQQRIYFLQQLKN